MVLCLGVLLQSFLGSVRASCPRTVVAIMQLMFVHRMFLVLSSCSEDAVAYPTDFFVLKQMVES
jgi:hypothetical protein